MEDLRVILPAKVRDTDACETLAACEAQQLDHRRKLRPEGLLNRAWVANESRDRRALFTRDVRRQARLCFLRVVREEAARAEEGVERPSLGVLRGHDLEERV